MTPPVVRYLARNLNRIPEEAAEAATQYSSVNDACPYPFGSPAGQQFKQHFEQARMVIDAKSIAEASKAAP